MLQVNEVGPRPGGEPRGAPGPAAAAVRLAASGPEGQVRTRYGLCRGARQDAYSGSGTREVGEGHRRRSEGGDASFGVIGRSGRQKTKSRDLRHLNVTPLV